MKDSSTHFVALFPSPHSHCTYQSFTNNGVVDVVFLY